jgi:peroxiredoxin
VKEFPDLVDTYRRFQNRNFDLITITLDPPAERPPVKKFLQSRHAALSDNTAPSLKKDGRTSNNYHWIGENPDTLAEAIDPEWSGALPHTVLLSADGKILWRHTGELDFVETRRQIVNALE